MKHTKTNGDTDDLKHSTGGKAPLLVPQLGIAMRHITEDLGRIDQAIAMLEGYAQALKLLSGDLAPLEDSEMFEDTEARPLSETTAQLNHYIAALKWKKASLDPNSPERIEQRQDFTSAINEVFGFNFM